MMTRMMPKKKKVTTADKNGDHPHHSISMMTKPTTAQKKMHTVAAQ